MSALIDEIDRYLKDREGKEDEETLKRKTTSLYQFATWVHDSEEEARIGEQTEWYDVVNAYVSHLQKEYPDSTVTARYYSITTFISDRYNYEIDEEESLLAEYDVSPKAKYKEEFPKEDHYLSTHEYELMLNECDKLKNEIILRLLWETGARASEIVQVRDSHVTLEAETDEEQDRHISLPTLKNDDVNFRDVFFSPTTKQKLEYWFDAGRERYVSTFEDDSMSYVLVGKQSNQLSRNRLNEIVREKADEAGIQQVLYEDASGKKQHRVTAHTFRRSYAVHRVKNGMDISFLRRLMGHKRIETTQQYLMYTKKDLQEQDDKHRP